MRLARLLGSLGLGLALSIGSLQAEEPSGNGSVQQVNWPLWRRAEPGCQSCPPPVYVPQGSGSGSASGSAEQPMPGGQDAFASAQEAGSGAGSAPANMFGDLVGYTGRTSSSGSSSSSPRFVPIANVGGFKISDNESPRPQDRFFVTYNYYNNVNKSLNASDSPSVDNHRELIGFEKAFLDGSASFGMRLPFIQTAATGANDSQVGDLTLLGKYAFINDDETGNVMSGGLCITVPTGKSFSTSSGASVNPLFFQPWAGGLLNAGDAYVHGFIAVEIPTQSQSVVLLSTDIGIGYWIYRSEMEDAILTGVAPTIEVHINNPLTHRFSSSSSDDIFLADQVNLTGGAVIMLGRNSTLGIAAGLPLAGPKPFSFEGLVSFNLRF